MNWKPKSKNKVIRWIKENKQTTTKKRPINMLPVKENLELKMHIDWKWEDGKKDITRKKKLKLGQQWSYQTK